MMHSDPHSISLSSTECSTISSQNVSSSNVGSFVDRFFEKCLLEENNSSSSSWDVSSSNIGSFVNSFFEKCLLEENDSSSSSWGEDSGFPVNSFQTLAKASDGTFLLLQDEEEEDDDDESDDDEVDPPEQEAFDLYATSLLTSVGDDQEAYEMVLQALLRATTQDVTIETLQQLASELGIQVCNYDEKNRLGLEMVLRCSNKETLQETTEDSCPICLEGLLELQEVQKLPCSHGMHVQCCERLFQTCGVKPLCPICRFDMSAVSPDPIEQKGATN